MGLPNTTRKNIGSVPKGDEAPSAPKLPPAPGRNKWSASRILEHGVPCSAVIDQAQSLGMRNSSGSDIYAFVLTVIGNGLPPYQTEIGNGVPADALALVYPGNTVPARRMPDGADYEIAIDWDAALAQVDRAIA
jgi:hypothetical protein